MQRTLILLIEHKADHSSITNGIELRLGRGVSIGNELRQFLVRVVLRVRRNIRLQAVLEVGDEAQVIFELNEDGLIVVCLPPAAYLGVVTLLKVAILAKTALCTVVRPYLDLPDVFSGKFKGLIVREHLDAVRNIVRAQFTLLK